MRLRDNAGQRRGGRVEIIIQNVCERRLLAEEALDSKNKACGQVPECYSTSGVMPELLILSYCVQQRVSIAQPQKSGQISQFQTR